MNSKDIELVEYKPSWPNLFLDLQKKLQSIASEVFVDIEHIGSTAIVGVKAKDIIDIQCAIKSFDDLPQVKSKLESIGFNLVDAIKQDHVPFHDMTYFSPQWEKRFFTGRYENQAYHIHIRLMNSLNWHFALQFKKFLSSNDKARYVFMQFKERLVAAGVDRQTYCSLKDSVIDLMSLQFDVSV